MKLRFLSDINKAVAVLLCISLALWPLISAAKDIDQDEAYRLRQQGIIIPLEQVLQKAKRRHPGKVIEIELEREENKLLYEIEVLDKRGIVWEMKFDAKTGGLIKDKKDN